MPTTFTTPAEYIASLPEDRQGPMQQLRDAIARHIDKDYDERITYGMIGYVVPHTLFPAGYHCDPKLPLGYMSIASQKTGISVHHMGLYMNKTLTDWFVAEYPKHTTAKLDMGKGCIRFKKPDQIPFDLIGQLAGKLSAQQWMEHYEKALASR